MKDMKAELPGRALVRTLVLALVVVFAGCGQTDEDASEIVRGHMAQARFFLSQGQLRAAMIELRNAGKVDDQNAEIHSLMGEVLLDGEAARPALQEFLKAVELGDRSPETQLKLGRTYLLAGDPESARETLDNVATDDALLLGKRDLALTSVHLATGDLDGAVALASDIVERAAQHVETAAGEKMGSELEFIQESLGRPEATADWATLLAGAHTVKAAVAVARERYSAADGLLERAVDASDGYAEAWLWKSRLASLQGDHAGAEKSAYKVLEEASRDVLTGTAFEAQQTIISAKAQQGKFSEAYQSYKNFLDAYPNSAPAHFARAVRQLEDQDLAGAEDAVRRVLNRMPAHTPSQLILGMISYAKGDLESATELFASIAQDQEAGGAAQRLYAMALIRRGRAPDAIELLKPAVEGAPDDAELVSLLGLAHASAGNATEAEAQGQKALALAPGSAEILTTAGEVAALNGKIDVAVERLNRAIEIDPGAERARFLLMQALLDRDDLSLAAETVSKWLINNPDSAAVQRAAAELAFRKGDIAEAEDYLQRAYSLSPRNLPVAYRLAELHVSNGKYEDAESIYRAIVYDDPDQIAAYRGLINSAVVAGRGESMLTYMQDEIDTNPNAVAPRLALADFSLRDGKPEEALALSEEVLRINRSSSEGRLLKGSAELALGNPDAARDTFIELTVQDPDSWLAHFRLASTERVRGDAVAARVSAEKALSLKPDYAPAIAIVTSADIAEGRYGEAAKRVRWLKEKFPESPAGYELEGDLASRRGDVAGAVAAYDAALKRSQPPDGRFLIKKGEARSRLGEGRQAVDEMNAWLENHPGNPGVRVASGVLMQQLGDSDGAIRAYETALAGGAEDTVLLNNLAWLYFEKGDPRALDTARRAHERAPESPSVLDTYGWILVQQDDVDAGLPLLEEAARLAPDVAAIREHVDQARSLGNPKP